MTKPSKDESRGLQQDPARELDELGPAVRDVAHQLTHDMSDTPRDVRDALALAPLAAVKILHACANMMARRPRGTVLALAGLAAAAMGALAIARRRRS